jgi:hypothetical protein
MADLGTIEYKDLQSLHVDCVPLAPKSLAENRQPNATRTHYSNAAAA